MRMGVENPHDLQPFALDVGQQRVGIGGRHVARLLVEVEHRVDDRRPAAGGIGDHVLEAAGLAVVQRMDQGVFARMVLQGHGASWVVVQRTTRAKRAAWVPGAWAAPGVGEALAGSTPSAGRPLPSPQKIACSAPSSVRTRGSAIE